MKTCPWVSVCGGCKYDFTAPDYHDKKMELIADWPLTDAPYWTAPGLRRRIELGFADGVLGLFQAGTKNIVPITNCPNVVPEINDILPRMAEMAWNGSGAALVTSCENGIDISITSDVPYFSREFRDSARRVGAIRVTWNGAVVFVSETPRVKFETHIVDYPPGAFLQPSVASESAIRNFVKENATGAKRVADLFCGLGNFTFALNADGFDISGTGKKRDLFKNPLPHTMLNNYDCIIMDPPRAGAMAQCKELVRSSVPTIIYVSCNPDTLRRDAHILTNGGYKCTRIAPFDQFVGAAHWEIAAVFKK